MKKSQIITILIIVIIVLVVAFFLLLGNGKIALSPVVNNVLGNIPTSNITNNLSQNNQPVVIPQILGNKADLVSFSIKPGETVSGSMQVIGTVKGGYFFEGEITLNILDSNKKVLKTGYGTATDDWMNSGPISFSGTMDFSNLPLGAAYLEIHNNNPGWPDEGFNKSILIPIIIN